VQKTDTDKRAFRHLEKAHVAFLEDALLESALPESGSQEPATIETALKELDVLQFGILASEAGELAILVALFRERLGRLTIGLVLGFFRVHDNPSRQGAMTKAQRKRLSSVGL
jgi:hypothetical protein